uniref:Superoxide reductase n=1 Tax=Candidatus Kentrum sp. DK TaxID=2126562 RepID=A0A450STJ0_9GAMM|nr:MAG: superoxide reductase [Candidatus Kentron sp. DK]
MQRRDLIKLTFATAAATTAGTLLPAISSASPTVAANLLAGSVFYTKDAQGRWEGKAASHAPEIKIEKNAEAISVTVATGHEMKGFEHYIIKHILLDKDYAFIGEKMFDPSKDVQAISKFSLDKDYSGPIYALSVCNKHDTWLRAGAV